MIVEIFHKSGGAGRVVTEEPIVVDAPSVVRIQMARSNVAALERIGNDLVITTVDGNTIRISNFYVTGMETSPNDLVFQEDDGSMWLAKPGDVVQFQEVTNWDDLIKSSLAASDDSDGGVLLPLLGLLGAGGIAAAASGGGGGGKNPPPPTTPPVDTTPPAAPTAALVADTGSSNTDKITNNGTVQVGNVEPGAKVQYQINGGPWVDVTGTSFVLPAGTNTGVQVRQVDAAGNVGPPFTLGTVIVDNVAPAVPAAALVADTGSSSTDRVTSNGTVQVSNLEAGAKAQYQINGGAWVDITGTSFVLPQGTHPAVSVRQVDVAGNPSAAVLLGTVVVDTTIPAAPVAALADDTGSSNTDKITRNGTVNVSNVEPGARGQYQINGGPWIDITGTSFVLPEGTHPAVSVRQIDVAGNIGTAFSLGTVIVDNAAPAIPSAALVEDSGVSGTDLITRNGAVQVGSIEPGARGQYQVNGGPWIDITGTSFVLPEGTYPAVSVRQVDAAGNAGGSFLLGTVVVDTTPPATLTAALANDTGSSNADLITQNGTVNVSAPEAGAKAQYQINGGPWVDIVGTSFVLPEGINTAVLVRQVDVAGNSSTPTPLGTVIVDNAAPTPPTAALADDTGSSNTDRITQNGTVNVGAVENGATVQYQINGGPWVDVVGTSFVLPDGTSTAVNVRQVDAAGNPGSSILLGTVIVDTSNPGATTAALVADTGSSNSDLITMNGTVNVGGLEGGAKAQYQINGGAWIDATGTSFVLPEGTNTAVLVRQVDAAGNAGPSSPLGTVVVDTVNPAAMGIMLAADTGSSQSDLITTNPNIVLTGMEPNSIVEWRDAAAVNPVWTVAVVTGNSFALPQGTYGELQVRQRDVAGNQGAASSNSPGGTITIDTTPPGSIIGNLVLDTGSFNNDGVTKDGRIQVVGRNANHTVEYSTDNGAWQPATLTGETFTLSNGNYPNLQIRQVDVAGNPSAPYFVGNFQVDTIAPAAPTITPPTDGGVLGDTITNSAVFGVSGVENGAILQYRDTAIHNDNQWITIAVSGNTVTLPSGSYTNLQFRQVDLAGNEGAPAVFGSIIIDTSAPPTPTVLLEVDTGVVGDFISQNGKVNVLGIETGATVQYRVGTDVNWTTVVGGTFTLPPGVANANAVYSNVQVRQVDTAGNASPPRVISSITVDTFAAPPTGELQQDTGTPGDRITQNNTIQVSGIEAGGRGEYSVNNGPWVSFTGTSFTLPAGSYEDLRIRQIDVAGNQSAPSTMADFTILPSLDARDDVFTLNMGIATETTSVSSDSDRDIIDITGPNVDYDDGFMITVPVDQSGKLTVDVSATSLGAFGTAIVVKIYDATGNLVFDGASSNSPRFGVGTTFDLLTIVNNDAVRAEVSSLLPGNYYVVVQSDPVLVNAFTLDDLAQAGETLTAADIAVIIDSLSVGPLTIFRPAIEIAVNGLIGLPLNGLRVALLLGVGPILGVGSPLLGELIDDALANVVATRIAVWQSVDIEATLVTYDYDNENLLGNVITGNDPSGVDVADGARVISVSFGGQSISVPNTGEVSIRGKYGTLSIGSNGAFEYTADGDPNSIGEKDVFTYTLSDGAISDSATLTINLNGVPATPVTFTLVDDVRALDMGEISSVTGAPVVRTNVDVVEVLQSADGYDAGVLVNVAPDRSGSLKIEVRQSALVSFADAYRVEVYDSAGNLVYLGVGDESLVGTLANAQFLGLVGNEGLVANVTGLPPGNYYVLVANDQSKLDQIASSLELTDLGQGAVLGAQNQAIILGAINMALGNNLISQGFVNSVALALVPFNNSPLTPALAALGGILNGIPGLTLVADVDDILDAVGSALLSNTLSLLQVTNITTTLTEYDFDKEDVVGNVFIGFEGTGADDVPAGTKVRSISSETGGTKNLNVGGGAQIEGKYGILTIFENGQYRYDAYGDPHAVGQQDVFTYRVSLLGVSQTATLTINIDGSPVSAGNDVGDAGTEWENVVENGFFNTNGGAASAAFLPGSYNSAGFVVTSDMKVVGTATVVSAISAVQAGRIFLQRNVSGNNWVDVAGTDDSFNGLINVLLPVAQLNMADYNLAPGTYRVAIRLTGLASAVNVAIDFDKLLVNQFELVDTVDATGNLFSNDELGSPNTALSIKSHGSATFSAVTGETHIDGLYGTLTIKADGSYVYKVDPDIAYSANDRTESFDYKLLHPSNVEAVGTLDITIHPDTNGLLQAGRAGDDMTMLLDSYLGTESEGQDYGTMPLAEPANDPLPLDHLALNPQEDEPAVAYV